MSKLNFNDLWALVTEQYIGEPNGPHAPTHWQRVMGKGLALAPITGADAEVVRLFALFHDCKRVNEANDTGHGPRGAEFARQLHGELFTISDDQLNTLIYACTFHSDGEVSDDPTIGTCWDADRLDLHRVGIIPDQEFMSTEAGRHMAIMGKPGEVDWTAMDFSGMENNN